MPFQRAHPLRRLSRRERQDLEAVSLSRSAAALEVAHAKELLGVDDGLSYRAAAEAAGMHSRHSVAALVRRFNEQSVDAIKVAHAGGPPVVYDDAKKERILAELAREPDRASDGTATWLVKTLQRCLRKKGDDFARIRGETVWQTLREAGKSWQKDRSWADTGKVLRRRKRDGATVEVIDCDKAAKKTDRNSLPIRREGRSCRLVRGRSRTVPSTITSWTSLAGRGAPSALSARIRARRNS